MAPRAYFEDDGTQVWTMTILAMALQSDALRLAMIGFGSYSSSLIVRGDIETQKQARAGMYRYANHSIKSILSQTSSSPEIILTCSWSKWRKLREKARLHCPPLKACFWAVYIVVLTSPSRYITIRHYYYYHLTNGR